MSSKGHLRGFLLVLTYYASINRGVSKKVAKAYPDITPYPRPDPVLPANLNPHWLTGGFEENNKHWHLQNSSMYEGNTALPNLPFPPR
jgi:hypothetical protein